ncbi:hypothetical protein C8D70_10814 [Chryseobacterium sp. CBTAP 102]|uniref:hypothetical protein n=1 Tax=Chryseobacterium TaxID=59732 RepID=UPI00083B0FFE|nr:MULTISPECIES: hypothetical protein [Chryseobacterium]PXW13611.1 hypothetical protein C8D70_10814 [Chryseobacterium sp. CBTAP 102]UHO37102.1 hypothetical protein H5J24_15215 [Chryseobacterium capnotolerans]
MNEHNHETVNIELSNDVIYLWNENDKSKYSELKKELQYSEDLVTFLSRYQKERWVADSIDYIEITENPNELHIDYTIKFFSGCRDLDAEDGDFIVVNYKINLESCEIEIIGKSIPEERSTFEEF